MRGFNELYQKRTCEKHHPQKQSGSAYQLRGVQPAGFRQRLVGVADRVTQRLDHELSVYLHEGFWHPMDTLRDRNYLEELWSSGRAPWKKW